MNDDITVTVKVKRQTSKKLLAKSDILRMIDRKASAILNDYAWLSPKGEPVIPSALDEEYLQALYDIRNIIESGNLE